MIRRALAKVRRNRPVMAVAPAPAARDNVAAPFKQYGDLGPLLRAARGF